MGSKRAFHVCLGWTIGAECENMMHRVWQGPDPEHRCALPLKKKTLTLALWSHLRALQAGPSCHCSIYVSTLISPCLGVAMFKIFDSTLSITEV